MGGDTGWARAITTHRAGGNDLDATRVSTANASTVASSRSRAMNRRRAREVRRRERDSHRHRHRTRSTKSMKTCADAARGSSPSRCVRSGGHRHRQMDSRLRRLLRSHPKSKKGSDEQLRVVGTAPRSGAVRSKKSLARRIGLGSGSVVRDISIGVAEKVVQIRARRA